MKAATHVFQNSFIANYYSFIQHRILVIGEYMHIKFSACGDFIKYLFSDQRYLLYFHIKSSYNIIIIFKNVFF